MRHGAYTLSYKASDTEFTIDAVFSNGFIDTLHYRSNDPTFGRISGSLNRNGDGIWVQGVGQIMYTQIFHNHVFIGAMTQDMTTGDTDNSLEAIHAMRIFVNSVGKEESFYVDEDDSYYLFAPVTRNSLLTDGANVFTSPFNYLHERALFFLYDYHFAMWPIDLVRGEIMCEYAVCYALELDETKNKEEADRKAQEMRENIIRQAGEDRRQAELQEKLRLFEATFYQTELGNAVRYLLPHVNLPDYQYTNKMAEYFKNRLSRIDFESIDTGAITVSTSSGLEDSYTLIVPTEIGLKEDNICVTQAIIFYFNNNEQRLNLYLQYNRDEISLGDETNSGFICNSHYFSIKENGNNYVATFSGEEYAVLPADLSKRNKKGCFYLRWQDDDIDSVNENLSKEEVQRPIEERFNKEQTSSPFVREEFVPLR